MAAGVADLRQGVVLAEVGESDRPFAPARAECGVEAERAALDRKPALLQPVGEQAARELLLHRQLRIRVNLTRDLDQVIPRGRDRCLSHGLCFADLRAVGPRRCHSALYSTRAGAIIRHAYGIVGCWLRW